MATLCLISRLLKYKTQRNFHIFIKHHNQQLSTKKKEKLYLFQGTVCISWIAQKAKTVQLENIQLKCYKAFTKAVFHLCAYMVISLPTKRYLQLKSKLHLKFDFQLKFDFHAQIHIKVDFQLKRISQDMAILNPEFCPKFQKTNNRPAFDLNDNGKKSFCCLI